MDISEEYKKELSDFITDRIGRLCHTYERDALNSRLEDELEYIVEPYYVALSHIMGADWCENGVSKLVIAFKEYPDVVFKFPFKWVLSLNLDDFWGTIVDEDTGETSDYSPFIVDESRMYGADASIEMHDGYRCDDPYFSCSESDYCRREELEYNWACDNGVGDMLAETSYLCTTTPDQVIVYISERCDNLDRLTPSVESQKSAKESFKSHHRQGMNESTGGMFIEDYGKTRFERLLDYLHEYCLSDIHSGNVMRRPSDGKIVIVDYSDYNGD